MLCTADADETISEKSPAKVVEALSKRKALAVYDKMKNEETFTKDMLILGADTVVALDGEIMGKPKDRQDAKRMITALQGRAHEVFTGASFVYLDEQDNVTCHSFHECTKVYFHPMDEAEVIDYVSCGECDDKAGAYGIQGRAMRYIEKIEGDYQNVVGLPLARICMELKKLGITV